MIQRIQSVYLLLVAIISTTLVLSDVPFYTETGIPEDTQDKLTITVDFNSTDTATEQVGRNDMLVYFLGAVSLISIIAIFLFKNRKLQMRLALANIGFLIVVFAAMYMRSFGSDYTAAETEQSVLAGFFIPLTIGVFSFLAYARIKKDEKLVRSLDRLR